MNNNSVSNATKEREIPGAKKIGSRNIDQFAQELLWLIFQCMNKHLRTNSRRSGKRKTREEANKITRILNNLLM